MAPERSKKDPSTETNVHQSIVNKNTPYEKLIAAKLDQIPVPKLADDIWSSIEAQLDFLEQLPESEDKTPEDKTPEDKTSDDKTPEPKTQAPENEATRLKGKGWYGLSGALIISAGVLLYTTQRTSAPVNTTPAQETIMPAEKTTEKNTKKTTDKMPDSINNVISPQEHKVPVKKENDTMSVMHMPDIPIPMPKDSVTQETHAASTPAPDAPLKHMERVFDTIDTIMEKRSPKKPKGVKGLTEDDYKIKIIKDSTLKKA